MYKYCALYEFLGFFSYSFREKKKRKKTSIKLKYCKFCRTVWRVCIKWIERKMATINRGYSKRNSQKRSNFDCFCRTSGFPSGRGPKR